MTHHKIILGDCLEGMKLLEDESADLVLTDPPYGITACDWEWDVMTKIDSIWSAWRRTAKSTAAILISASEPFSSKLVVSNLQMFRYEWIWEKTNATGFLDAPGKPLRAHEHILVFYAKQPTYNPQKTKGHTRKVSKARHKEKTQKNQPEIYGKSERFADYDSTERYPRSVLVFKSDKQRLSLHPTQKPLALIRYLIKTYSNEGDTILDPFAGSFTTAKAARDLKRNSISIEINADYWFDIGEARLKANIPTLDNSVTFEIINLNEKEELEYRLPE